jgi:Ser/Thr protein kinase RdoA (MazF antagonist)
MSVEKIFQERINYKGDLFRLMLEVCKDFRLGEYKGYHVITIGYEDLNIHLSTNHGAYLVKVLSNSRDEEDRSRYSEIIQAVICAGIVHPKLYRSDQGYLHTITIDQLKVYLFVMQYINGRSFYDLNLKPTRPEIRFLSQQAARINQLEYRPKYVYDDWAIVNFLPEYEKIRDYLSERDVSLIEPLSREFRTINLETLPHCFVHGDIIDTNILRDEFGKLWIIDFSVSNFNPRIQELAVLSCNLFNRKTPNEFDENFRIALQEYEKVLKLTDRERILLPTWIKVAHAMHIIGATRSKVRGEVTQENHHWLEAGRDGLFYISQIWK